MLHDLFYSPVYWAYAGAVVGLIGIGYFVAKRQYGNTPPGLFGMDDPEKSSSVNATADAQIAFVAVENAIESLDFGIAHAKIESCVRYLALVDESHYKKNFRRRIELLEGQITAMADGAVAAGNEYLERRMRERNA